MAMDLTSARLLVVDDNADNRDVLARRLKRLGLTKVSEAADGIEALDLVRAESFDLVLLDVMMPRMNGVEMLEAMKGEGRLETTPVVMISAASELDTVVRCIELGAEDYLPKPFNAALLAARVRAVLEKKFLRAQNAAQLARLERELAEARLHQQAMLPSEFPVNPALVDIHATIQPALEVGGDLYDIFEVRPGLICLAVGDVAGKGTAAALVMARTRSLLRAGTLQFQAITGRTPLPSEIAAHVNDELCRNNPHMKFVTLLIGFYDLAAGMLTYCNAGHVYPVAAGRDGAREVPNAPDPALGIIEDVAFTDHVLPLGVGDTLVLASDGLTDILDREMNSFGTERVLAQAAAAAGMTAREAVRHLLEAARRFSDGAPQFDDLTVMALRRLA